MDLRLDQEALPVLVEDETVDRAATVPLDALPEDSLFEQVADLELVSVLGVLPVDGGSMQKKKRMNSRVQVGQEHPKTPLRGRISHQW
ncbi:MAG: hypothetical protein WBN10_04780 [Polyangiales bacterium]